MPAVCDHAVPAAFKNAIHYTLLKCVYIIQCGCVFNSNKLKIMEYFCFDVVRSNWRLRF